MVVSRVVGVVGLFLGLAFVSSAFGAKIQPVYSLKNLGDQTNAAGQSFQKVQVKCNTGPEFRYIHRNSGVDDWCVNGNAAECFVERIEAATRACNLPPKAVVASAPKVVTPATPSPEELQAQAERKALEEELLANQQKKLELRSRQLELRKRELELQAKQGNN